MSLPIPIEEVLDLQLKLTFEIDDLRATFGSDDTSGIDATTPLPMP